MPPGAYLYVGLVLFVVIDVFALSKSFWLLKKHTAVQRVLKLRMQIKVQLYCTMLFKL